MTDDRFEEYRRNAQEAERWAFRAPFAEEREAYLRIAKGWLNLIDGQERLANLIYDPKPR